MNFFCATLLDFRASIISLPRCGIGSNSHQDFPLYHEGSSPTVLCVYRIPRPFDATGLLICIRSTPLTSPCCVRCKISVLRVFIVVGLPFSLFPLEWSAFVFKVRFRALVVQLSSHIHCCLFDFFLP